MCYLFAYFIKLFTNFLLYFQDVDCAANNIVTSGVDHAIKIWKIHTNEIKDAVKSSYKYNILKDVSFPTLRIHFPDFTTREVHGNYIDCVFWYGNFVVSKVGIIFLKLNFFQLKKYLLHYLYL